MKTIPHLEILANPLDVDPAEWTPRALEALRRHADFHAAQEPRKVLSFAPRKRPRHAPRRTTDPSDGERRAA